MFKAAFKMSIVAALICTTLACGQKEAPPQPKEQESQNVTAPQPVEQKDPTVTAVTTLFKKWDQALNTNDPDKLMEIIPTEIKERNPEEAKKMCTGMVGALALELKDVNVNMNTSVDRIVIENDEGTKATVYVTHAAIDLKTQKPSPSKASNSYPIIKEAGEWKFDVVRQAETARKKLSGLVISLSYEGRKYEYRIFSAEVYNGGEKTESISPSNFVLVTDHNESIEAEIPFERGLLDYKNLLNLNILPKTRTSGYLFFKTANSVQYIIFLPTGQKFSS